MAANTARINFAAKAFVDRPGVMSAVRRWQLARLGRAGAYARGAMKKQIKPQLKGRKKDRLIELTPNPWELPARWRNTTNPKPVLCLVQPNGVVLDAKTMRMVSKSLASRARVTLKSGNRGRGEGQPPRRGPTDKLRKHIYFNIDKTKPSVVIGPEPFPRQPQMLGRVSVPQLLNKGGIEIIMGDAVAYGPRPFVETILKPALKILKEDIRKHPVGKRI